MNRRAALTEPTPPPPHRSSLPKRLEPVMRRARSLGVGRLPLLLLLVVGAALIGAPSAEPARAQSAAAQSVPSDWALIPEGLEPGDSFRLLFVTSMTRAASSAEIGDYNAHVQAAAGKRSELAGFSGEFRALISTATVDARDNTGTTGTGVAVYWLGGAKVADDYADLYDRSWDSAAARTEAGAGYSGLVWTGGNKMGGKSGLRHAGAAEVRLGDVRDPNGLTLPLSSPNAGASSDAYPLYALSPVFTVAEPESESESESEPDQPGVVVVRMDSKPNPVGSTVRASLRDPDGLVSDVTWQWARSADRTEWETIGGATGATYTVTSNDLGHYLQATASYSDPHGPDKTAGASTSNPVVQRARQRLLRGTAPINTATGAGAEVWSATLTVGEDPQLSAPDPNDRAGGKGYCAASSNCSATTNADAGYGKISDASFAWDRTDYTVTSIRWGFGPENEGKLHLQLNRDLPDEYLFKLTLEVGSHRFALSEATRGNTDGTDSFVNDGASNNYRWKRPAGWTNPATGSEVTVRIVKSPDPHPVQSGIIWATTLTANRDRFGTLAGCDNDTTVPLESCSSRLTEDEFSYGGSDYKVEEFYHSSATTRLYLRILTSTGSNINTKTTFSALTLRIGNSTFKIEDALSSNATSSRISWSTSRPGLSNGMKYLIALFLPPGLPGEPWELSARRGHEEVMLSWRDPIDPGISKYQVQQKAGEADWPTDWTDITGSGAATTSHTVTGLTNGTAYRFRIRAVSAAGGGPHSEAGPVTPSGAPYAPEGLTAAAAAGRVNLSWSEAVDPSGSGITKRQVQRRAGNDLWGDWTDIPNSAAGEANATSYRVTGLKNGTSWGFRVRAVNANGAGDASATARATPSRSGSPTVSSVEIISRPRGVGGGDTYSSGEKIRIWVRFSPELIVIEGRPVVALHVGGTKDKPVVRYARFLQWWGDNGALFEYKVAYADRDADGISIPKNALIPLGRIYDRESDRDVNPKHAAVADNPAHRVNGVVGFEEEIVQQLEPKPAPRLERFSMRSSPASGESYAVGEQIRVGAVFSETPIVAGRPTLALKVGSKIRQMELRERRFSFHKTILFTYTVQKGDIDGDGISIPANPFRTSESDRFYNSWDRKPAVLTTDGMSARSGHKIGMQVWSSTMTVHKSDEYHGCDNNDDAHNNCSDVLAEDEFRHRGKTYRVQAAFWQSAGTDGNTFAMTFDDVSGNDDVMGSRAKELFANLVLNVNGAEFAVKDAVVRSNNEDIIQWVYNPDPDDWDDGDEVNLSLWAPVR